VESVNEIKHGQDSLRWMFDSKLDKMKNACMVRAEPGGWKEGNEFAIISTNIYFDKSEDILEKAIAFITELHTDNAVEVE